MLKHYLLSLVVWEVLDNPRVEEDIRDVISRLLVFAEHVLKEVDALIAYIGPNLS